MEFEKSKIKISKLDIVAILLILLFALTLLSGHERLCALVYQSHFNQYREILGDKTKNFRGQKLGIGHKIRFNFKENKKSLSELYSLTNIEFIPENKALSIWKGEDKVKVWHSSVDLFENMQRFRVRFTIPVPENEILQGKTIKGSLHLKLSYPILVDYTAKKSSTHSEIWDRPCSVYIFSKAELNELSLLTNKMMNVWTICLVLLFLPVLIILINHIHNYRKKYPVKIE